MKLWLVWTPDQYGPGYVFFDAQTHSPNVAELRALLGMTPVVTVVEVPVPTVIRLTGV